MSDLTIQVCSFNTPSKSAHKYIDKQSVETVLNSERFKENLKKGRLLGLFTHKDRYTVDDKNIPFEDNIATSKFLCNCCRKMWIDEQRNALMGDFDLLNNDYGNLLRDMYKKGIMMPVSMSVSAHADNSKYYIDDILGVDMTQRPDLEAEVVSVSFSEHNTNEGSVRVCFSQVLDESNCVVNCSNTEEIVDEDVVSVDNIINKPTYDSDEGLADVNPNPNDAPISTGIPTEQSISESRIAQINKVADANKRGYVEVTRVGGIKEDEDFEDDTNNRTPNRVSNVIVSDNRVSAPDSLVNKLDNVSNKLDVVSAQIDNSNLSDTDTLNKNLDKFKPVDEDKVSEQPVVTNLNTDGGDVVKNQTNLDCGGVAGNSISNIDPTLNEFSEEVLDNTNYEEIHKDIDVADQMTADQLKQLPNKITSTVETVFSELTEKKQLNCSELSIEDLKASAMKKNGTVPTDFSISSYVAEFNLQPWQVLKRRISEVIQICRAKKQDWINANYEKLRAYFDSYILTWVQNILNNPSTEFNIILGLRLANYQVENKKMREFNRTIKRMRTQLNNVGFMDKLLQNKLNTQFQAIENDIYTFINNKVGESGKKFVPQGNIEPAKIA